MANHYDQAAAVAIATAETIPGAKAARGYSEIREARMI